MCTPSNVHHIRRLDLSTQTWVDTGVELDPRPTSKADTFWDGQSVHGIETIEKKVSGYYIADEISGTYRGIMIAIPQGEWIVFRQLTQSQMVELLIFLAGKAKTISDPRTPSWA